MGREVNAKDKGRVSRQRGVALRKKWSGTSASENWGQGTNNGLLSWRRIINRPACVETVHGVGDFESYPRPQGPDEQHKARYHGKQYHKLQEIRVLGDTEQLL
jgi:hypothetical protein